MKVYDYIVKNYIPYDGDEGFLSKATKRTLDVWNYCLELLKSEQNGNYIVDSKTPSTIVISSSKSK